MDLSQYKRTEHKRKRPWRVGRGHSSGSGKTAGRGNEGLGQRSGSRVGMYYEGGQMPLFRRLPKRGFTRGRFKNKIERKRRKPLPEGAAPQQPQQEQQQQQPQPQTQQNA